MCIRDRVRRYLRFLGISKGLTAMLFVKLLPRVHKLDCTLPLPVPQSSTWVRARCGTTDQCAYSEVFLSSSYRVDPAIAPGVVVDAGANVGYASVLFAETWPGARIIALEPDESNYQLLVRNTRSYGNVEPVKAALWGEPVALRIENPQDPKWMLRVTSTEGIPEFPTLTVSDILIRAKASHIDILKLDIEGAEYNLFTRDPRCLDHVSLLMVELHERFARGATRAFHDALRSHTYEITEMGTTVHVRFAE